MLGSKVTQSMNNSVLMGASRSVSPDEVEGVADMPQGNFYNDYSKAVAKTP